jgi:predicted metal-dependent HD superfamily phosphohydrolase
VTGSPLVPARCYRRAHVSPYWTAHGLHGDCTHCDPLGPIATKGERMQQRVPIRTFKEKSAVPMSPERWQQLLGSLHLPADTHTCAALIAAYGEPHRHYHTAQHIDQCLAELDLARPRAADPAEVEMALWFHDAVYDTHRTDNEQQSAAWAQRFLTTQGLEPARVQRIVEHILATRHTGIAGMADSQLTVDADLAILGAPADRYRDFESNVRKEYSWVPEPVFRDRRAEILQSFLDRPGIYHTAFFRERHEAAARANLAAAIRTLRA